MTEGFTPFYFGERVSDNVILRQTALDYLKGTRADFFGANFSRTYHENLVKSALDRAKVAELDRDNNPYAEAIRYGSMARYGLQDRYKAPTQKISAEEANERFGLEGQLHFDKPITAEAAQLMMRLKQEEIERNQIISSYDASGLENVAAFGVNMAASMLDPVQFGAMFVPIVGEARMAVWTGKYGVTTARLMKGATEGFVGTAALEPFILSNNKALQYDYNEWDSFMNIAFGTVIGSGLHAGLGKIGDLIDRGYISGKAHNKAAQTATGQLLADQQVNVKPILDADAINTDINHKVESIKFRKETSPATTLTPESRTKATIKDVNVRRVGDSFEVSFKNEKGYLSTIRGVGETAEEALTNLKQDYDVLLNETPGELSSKKAYNKLKEEYDYLNSTEGSSKFIDAELRENGFPVDVVAGYEQRIKELEAQKSEAVNYKKPNKKIKELDKEIERLKTELKGIKQANAPGSLQDALAKLKRKKDIIRARMKNLDTDITPERVRAELADYQTTQERAFDDTRQLAYNQQNIDSLLDGLKVTEPPKMNQEVISVKTAEQEIEDAIELGKRTLPEEAQKFLDDAIKEGDDIIELANAEAEATSSAIMCVLNLGI